jgi:hypothetical protein
MHFVVEKVIEGWAIQPECFFKQFRPSAASPQHRLLQMTSTQPVRFKNQIVALWKRFLSIRKKDWELIDYPVVIREHEFDAHFSSARFKQHRYVAYIVNWAVTGGGETPEDALRNLQINFQTIRDRRRLEGKPMIRPGVNGPLEFATQELISANPELNEDFIRRVLNLDWAWISDESSLWDFHTDDTNEKLWAKILEVYGVDVSDIESARLSEILNRIAATGWSADGVPGK